jgi:effector-binding domain-containing protein
MEPEVIDVGAQRVAIVRRMVALDQLPSFYDEAYGALFEAVTSAGGTPTGAAFGWYHGGPSETVDVAAGFPVAGLDVGPLEGDVEVVDRPGGRAVAGLHVGPYDRLAETYGHVEQWIDEQGLQARDDMWEEYLTQPTPDTDPATLETRIVFPLA